MPSAVVHRWLAHRWLWKHRIAVVLVTVAACLLVPTALPKTYYYAQSEGSGLPTRLSLLPQALLPGFNSEKTIESEYFEWETTSRFRPPSQRIGSHSTEQLCESFPIHMLETIQPVLRMGHTEPKDRVKAQLESVSACIEDLIIFSDVSEEIEGRYTYDILGDLPAAYYVNTSQLEPYLALNKLGKGSPGADGDAGAQGWALDKFKFLPMIERAWAMRPEKSWYFFYEMDTYVFWDNVFRFLENLDPDKPHYMGSPSPGRRDEDVQTWFGFGGTGFVISREAMRILLHRRTGKHGEFIDPPLSHRYMHIVKPEWEPCGDTVVGYVLYLLGVELEGYWPLFNPHPLHAIPYSDLYWCQPVLTLHKTRPEDFPKLWSWENQRRVFDRPLLYSDLFEFQHPGDPAILDGWDNGGWDERDAPETEDVNACQAACEADPGCFQFNLHGRRCRLMLSIRYGENRSTEEAVAPEERFTSGWLPERIDSWRNQRTCHTIEWVKPSLARIF